MCSISTSRAAVRSESVCEVHDTDGAGTDGGSTDTFRSLARFRSSARACAYAA